ncbi:MAG: flagellar motor protein MotA [Alphaproteobacteria bacterium]
MTSPRRFLFRMAVFLILVAGAIALLFPGLQNAFLAKPAMNGMIVGIILFGVAYIVRQVIQLEPEAAWADTLRRSEPGLSVMRTPRLLGPVATVLSERRGKVTLSAPAQRALLDGLSSRLDETRDISRYLIGLLVFLGLLGTFWGLLETVGAVSRVVSTLSMGGGTDMGEALGNLQRGLETPLAGMGTAFSSSLFGLGGSLVLGFLDLQAGQAQNRFYNEIEEWLSSLTRLAAGGPVGDGEQSVPAYIQALLEQTADNMENLQRILARGEESRTQANAQLTALTERLGTLTDQMRTEQTLMLRLAESQSNLQPVLAKLAESIDRMGKESGEEPQQLRAIERQLARLIETTEQSQATAAQEVRHEIRLLARTIAALSDEPERRR